MKFAILSDIHSNLEAFQTVLADIQSQGVTQIVCLGDVVGYHANPRERLQIIRDQNILCVKGNHDEYCSGEADLPGVSPRAARAIHWTRRQLTDDDRQWLRDLRYTQTVANFTMVHGTLDAPERWGYVFDPLAAAASFAFQTTPVCFFGHTHFPLVFMHDGAAVRGGLYSQFKLAPGKKYLVNVGSVGLPRDNNPKAAYVIFDADAGAVELRRLDFDQSLTRQKNLAAGL